MKTYKVEVDDSNTISWYNSKGQLHRENGPAVEFSNGSKEWFHNGKLHREDGPAVEYTNGNKYWYLNNVQYTESEFNAKMKKSELDYELLADLKKFADKHGYTLTPKK